MLEWLIRRRSTDGGHTVPVAEPANDERSVASGKSSSLHKYLDDRYADDVVLTFAEIEDLLGFGLPNLARLSDEWWTTPGPDAVRFADSWILANRSARPNLRALTVAFGRAR